MTKSDEPLMSIKEASEFLKVSPWTLRKWGNEGKLKDIRIGTRKDRRYQKSELLKMIQE